MLYYCNSENSNGELDDELDLIDDSNIKLGDTQVIANDIKPIMYYINPVNNKYYSYQRLIETYNIIGFVVNIHDITNFDIDLDINDELKKIYSKVISNKYMFQDITSTSININETYRCRLRGIGINQDNQRTNIIKNNHIYIEIKHLIDRSDGWIICTLSDIDIYQRLLVDIYLLSDDKIINLRDYILSKMKGDINPIFYRYINKHNIGY